MTRTLMKRLAASLVGSCAIVAVFVIATPGSATAACPYNGSYIDCLQDGNSVNWCKAHVLNCKEKEEALAPPCPYDSYTDCLQDGKSVDWCKTHVLGCAEDIDLGSNSDCTWLSDEPQEGCEDKGTYIRVGLPLDITLGSPTTCPYDSYVECLMGGKSVDWCKRYVLNCKEGPALYSILLPFTARVCLPGSCWPCVQGQGTIVYNGTPEIIGGQFCLHVSSFEYHGDYESTVENELINELKKPNPLCNNDTWCICTPLECVQDFLEE